MRLVSRALRAGVLLFILPTVLLAQLNSELVLLHTDCEGDPHFHPLETGRLNGSRAPYELADHCCGQHESDSAPAMADADNDCGHERPPIIIARQAFVATRAELTNTTQFLSSISCSAAMDVLPCESLLADSTWSLLGAINEPSKSTGGGVAAVLLRSHALLL